MNTGKGVAKIARLSLRHKIIAVAPMPVEREFRERERSMYLGYEGGSNNFTFFHSS